VSSRFFAHGPRWFQSREDIPMRPHVLRDTPLDPVVKGLDRIISDSRKKVHDQAPRCFGTYNNERSNKGMDGMTPLQNMKAA
jgi:hypothetical protein